jgi:serine/threonine-protein phosphatase 2B catalytic subunit
MDGVEGSTNPQSAPRNVGNRMQIDNALRALQQKKPVPEIDFTLHTMEDGSQASTMERVCKGRIPEL